MPFFWTTFNIDLLFLSYLLPPDLSLQCHVSCVPVFDSMSRKEIKPWGVVVTLSMIICLFVYTGTGTVLSGRFVTGQMACDWLSIPKCLFVFVQVSVAFWHLARMSVRMCWCHTLLMILLWPLQELLLSSASSPPTPFYTSVAGKSDALYFHTSGLPVQDTFSLTVKIVIKIFTLHEWNVWIFLPEVQWRVVTALLPYTYKNDPVQVHTVRCTDFKPTKKKIKKH